MSEIRVALFDFGNVVSLADQMIAYTEFAKFSELTPVEVYEKIYLGKIEKIPDEGGTLDDFYHRSIVAIGADPKKLTKELFREIWCNIFYPYPGIAELLDMIRPDVKKILVSNTNLIHWEGAMSSLSLIKKHFPTPNHQVLSFLVGKRKPDRLMWDVALEKGGCSAEQSLFIDDLPDFVFAYQDIFGGPGIIFNGRTDSIKMLKREFAHRGMLK